MLERLTKADFDPYLNDGFRIRLAEDRSTPIRLAEVVAYPQQPHGATKGRASFSLMFRGPKDCRLPQGIYTVEHEKLGALSIFLVPLQPDAEGTPFEAVFN